MVQRQLPAPKTRMLTTWKLKDMIRKKELIMDAPYQRAIVWETNKMSELVDSILNNYYIPPLLFATRKIRGKQTRIVIDGKQRLTSMRRFMRNLIPYIDTSSGESVSTYYANVTDNERDDQEEESIRKSKPSPIHFLDEAMFDKFSSYEFVCVEYSDISEDDEYEIFSRVQLGVAITSAEKLRAHNTPVAKLCRQLASEYSLISEVLQRKKAADVFQAVAHLMMTLKEDPKDFRGTSRALLEFVSSAFQPHATLTNAVKHVLQVYQSIISDEDNVGALSKRGKQHYPMRALEFLAFGKYISLVKRNRPPVAFARDFVNFREFLIDKRDGKFYLGRDAFNEAMGWVDRQVSQENLAPLVQSAPQYSTISSDEDEEGEGTDRDQLKHDEYEHEPTYTLPYQSSTPAVAHKRRRDERINGTVPVARRGRRLANGIPKR
ncbi:hypothetical protein BD560DRAFT_416895 [Blakeslea trispora]|nr:hypothetical protein BD560DRAFT_416895 [Blakeslea trispora]